ncbi:hypothetical protein, partial [Sphingopyxis sp.]|uniref:hypothetical protein n=1 Tax=Sphingopyxis sp. TaxID=1908224 RepID=UPI0040360004
VQSGAALARPLYIKVSANPRSGSCTGDLLSGRSLVERRANDLMVHAQSARVARLQRFRSRFPADADSGRHARNINVSGFFDWIAVTHSSA